MREDSRLTLMRPRLSRAKTNLLKEDVNPLLVFIVMLEASPCADLISDLAYRGYVSAPNTY